MYELAAKLATKAEKGQSYKTALYTTENKKIVKSVHFLVSNAVRRRDLIDKLLGGAGLVDELQTEPWLVRVAVAQLLWGRWRLPTTTPLFRKIIRHKEKFLKILPTLENEFNSKDDVKIPRYVRINTEAFTKEAAITHLKELGFSLLPNSLTYSDFLGVVKNLKKKEFVSDFHVPNLIVFSSKANISGLSPTSFIRQDKSSCLVSLLLAPVPGSSILDMCAAPGYKTQHAASLISKMGTLYSVEVNAGRYKTLEETCQKFGLGGICHPLKMDALKVTEDICPDVEYIIVDPPCSGTGIVNVLEKHTADDVRLRKLSNLQAMILKQSLSRFPCARRVVYSTCSVEEDENEKVVSECLDVAEENGFRLVPLGGAYKGSFSAGVGERTCASSVLRTTPKNDLTNGFFIALFERSVPPKLPSYAKNESAPNLSCMSTENPSSIPSDEALDLSSEHEHPPSDQNSESDVQNDIPYELKKLKKPKTKKISLKEPVILNSKKKKKYSSDLNKEDSSISRKNLLKKNISKNQLLSKGFKTLHLPLGTKKKILNQVKLPQRKKIRKRTFHSK